MSDRSASVKRVTVIGCVIKIDKLPFEIVRLCLKEFSIIPPRIKARINGAAGNENRRIM